MSDTKRVPASAAAAERGSVLVWAITVVMMIGGVVMAGIDEIQAVDGVMNASHEHDGLAAQVAQAGVTDAFAWFRRQPIQPVTQFAPQLDLAADTPLNETDDPTIGIVRTYEITPGLWARYEVRKAIAAESFSDANGNGVFDDDDTFTDADGNGRRDAARETRDVSGERGMPGDGTVWRIEATGMIYRRQRSDLPLGVGPNARVAQTKVATEIRRLTMSPPANAAICCKRGQDVSLGNRARVRTAAGTAVSYAGSTGSPSTGGAEVDGTMSSVPGYDAGVNAMFGVDWAELRSMADLSTTDGAQGIRGKLTEYSMNVVSDDIMFDDKRPLRGTGLLIVQGDCTIDAGSNSFFNGVLYVEGDLTVRAPAYLRGTVIVGGKLDVRGTGGDYVEIEYDETVINTLSRKMGQYRLTKAVHPVQRKLDDGRPTEARPGMPGFKAPTRHGPAIPAAPAAPASPASPAAPATPASPTPPTGFSVVGLRAALEGFINANPDATSMNHLNQALDKLTLADTRMAQNPPNVAGALNAAKQALNKLIVATTTDPDFSAGAFHDDLDGGSNTLMPQLHAMVSQMLDASTAPQSNLDAARAKYDDAVSKLERARTRMEGGNETGSLQDYKRSVARFQQAVDQIDDFS